MHYEFKEVFMNSQRGFEKGSVEQAVRYMEKNLFVPFPEFNNFEEYNRELTLNSVFF